MSREQAAWSDYWSKGGTTSCLPGAPPEVGELLRSTWAEWARSLPATARVLDIAAGSGAVMQALRATNPELQVRGVDYADAGTEDVESGIDAASLPFAAGSFEGVASQFGIEYCGAAAVAEAARVLVPSGRLQFICHHADSPAVAHNARRLAAMRAMEAAGLFDLARDIAAGRDADETRDTAIARARELHSGQSICGELPVALGQALGGRQPVVAVAALTGKAQAEMLRLAAMVAAAGDAGAIEALCDGLTVAGVQASATALARPDGEVLAWLVTGNRLR